MGRRLPEKSTHTEREGGRDRETESEFHWISLLQKSHLQKCFSTSHNSETTVAVVNRVQVVS